MPIDPIAIKMRRPKRSITNMATIVKMNKMPPIPIERYKAASRWVPAIVRMSGIIENGVDPGELVEHRHRDRQQHGARIGGLEQPVGPLSRRFNE